jgi:hypothetical protein
MLLTIEVSGPGVSSHVLLYGCILCYGLVRGSGKLWGEESHVGYSGKVKRVV